MNQVKSNDSFDLLANKVGEFIEYWGFKQIHGKIWLYLFLSSKPLDAKDLIDQLNVSKALVSLSLKELLHFKVIKVAGKSERSTVIYEANPDLGEVIGLVLKQREQVMLKSVKTTFDEVKNSQHLLLDQERVKFLGSFISNAQLGLEAIINMNAFGLLSCEKKPVTKR